MLKRSMMTTAFCLLATAGGLCLAQEQPLFQKVLNVEVPHISTDKSIKYDYDIVYVRAHRAGDEVHKRFYTDFSTPVTLEPGADLMLLHPDGSEELLVEGGEGSITDPFVSFDGQWVYYTKIHYLKKYSQWSPPRQGADIYKIHLKSRKIVQLTNQVFTPNTGAADWSSDYRQNQQNQGKSHFQYGVYNMGPCPLPGGKIVFTSNRDGFRPSKGYPAVALQLFVMDDRDESVAQDDPYPNNIEKIGHLNIAGALHPVVLADGRIMFSTLESQGIRSRISWGIWTIHPDGTNWAPLVSAFDTGGASNGFHFQTQLSDGSIIFEEYYNQNNSGFGAFMKMPPTPPKGYAAFGPAYMGSSRNKPWRFGRFNNGKGQWYRMPFMPTGSEPLAPFTHGREGVAGLSNIEDKNSPKVGKFTHPSGAPDNHLLTIYSPGPVNHQYKYLPQLDGGIYLVKNGKIIEEPAQMRLIKNDPEYNECWPRAVVPYRRVYGIDQPKQIEPLANDGKASRHLPEGTPFGLVGTSSMYKRESFPNGVVPEGSVTAVYSGHGNDRNSNSNAKPHPWKGLDAFTSHGNGMQLNWHNQGGDAGIYENDEIHAIRVLVMEPTTDRKGANSGRQFHNHASERLRILGEIPLRKFQGGKQPADPDGNPDTSFLAKIPADTVFTFQTIDADGLLLNMSQTWHQLRPGEIRNDCGGCHAHSQKPTPFPLTVAAKSDYKIWDLTKSTPLVTSKERDESKQVWDSKKSSGLRNHQGSFASVEYYRDVQPILKRSCVACHTKQSGKPAGNLALDADDEQIQYRHFGKFPGTYYRLALDEPAKFGHKPVGYNSWGYPNASRYIRKFQARRSLLVWKLLGRRTDGFSNDDHPSESKPGAGDIAHRGEQLDVGKNRAKIDIDFVGSVMPPPKAVAAGKVKPLTDEDRRTLLRWIDLGCPIDFQYSPDKPEERGFGWNLDDNRPTLALTYPKAGENATLSRILIGMDDFYTGIDQGSLSVVADFEIDGIAAGKNLADKFQRIGQGIWEYQLKTPITARQQANLTVSVKDRQGNTTVIDRDFSVKTRTARASSN